MSKLITNGQIIVHTENNPDELQSLLGVVARYAKEHHEKDLLFKPLAVIDIDLEEGEEKSEIPNLPYFRTDEENMQYVPEFPAYYYPEGESFSLFTAALGSYSIDFRAINEDKFTETGTFSKEVLYKYDDETEE